MRRMVIRLCLLLGLILALPTTGPSLQGPSYLALALDRQERIDVMAAVVQISWVAVGNGNVYAVGTGSGTIISPDGLILTNCHVADPLGYGTPPDQVPAFDYLGVNLTVRSDQPPQPAYLAEVVAADPGLDLAIIRITRNLDQSLVSRDRLNLPYVELGDSDSVEVGDELNIFGYPGIGGETITFTKGVVSGFSLDAAIEGRAWIKTDATIAGGNSGGTAVSESGVLVGVPTRAGAGGGAETVDCRPLADTNGDGRIDDRDTCIPVGGFINALRPVKLAASLVEATRLGIAYQSPLGGLRGAAESAGDPALANLFFSPGVNQFDQPTTVIAHLPSGARSLYLFFDYESVSRGTTLEMKVYVDGQEAPEFGLPAAPWTGGEQGTWWIGWSDADFADGTYRLELLLNGTKGAEAQIEIGGGGLKGPSFSNIELRSGATLDGEESEPTVLFSAATNEIVAAFQYANMTPGTEWTRSWLLDGQVGLTKSEAWTASSDGSTSLSLTSQDGLQPGAYRLNLFIEDRLAATTDFWVTDGPEGGASFEPIVFAEGVDQQGNPVGEARGFGVPLEELHAFSTYAGMEDGVDAGINWYVDGQQIIDSPFRWAGGETGLWHDYIYSKGGLLPDGEYRVELYVEGQLARSGSTSVRTGVNPAPTPEPQPGDGVQVQGTILDLDTERPISGALFLVLRPGITWTEFEWNDEEVYAFAETDRQGLFRVPALLERGKCYTLAVGAKGYWTIGEDGVCITQDTEPVLDLTVRLERQ
jgi:serine protease Do